MVNVSFSPLVGMNKKNNQLNKGLNQRKKLEIKKCYNQKKQNFVRLKRDE